MTASLETAKFLYRQMTLDAQDAARRQRQSDRYALLNDHVDGLLDRLDAQTYQDEDNRAELRRFRYRGENAYKSIIGHLAVLYRGSAVRYFADKDGQPIDYESALWAALCPGPLLDSRFERINQLALALNEVLVKPALALDGTIYPEIILPHHATVLAWGQDIAAILYALQGGRLQYWDRDTVALLDEDGALIVAYDNPLRVVPVVTYRAAEPEHFWSGPAGDDLYHGALWQYQARTQLARVLHTQSFKQVYVETEAADGGIPLESDNLKFGPGNVPIGKFNTLDLNTDSSKLQASIEAELDRLATNYGLPPDTIGRNANASGFEKLLSAGSLRQRRERYIKHFRRADKAYMNLARQWHNTYGIGPSFAMQGEPRLDYADGGLVGSTKEILDTAKAGIAVNAINYLDVVMQLDPDVQTYAEALKVLENNVAINAKVHELMASRNISADGTGNTPQQNGALGGRPPKPDSQKSEAERAKDQQDGASE